MHNNFGSLSIAERHFEYEKAYDYRIIKRLPLFIRVNGRSFSKACEFLPKPYCQNMIRLFALTMLNSVKQIEDCIFAYQFSDEIIFILRNDRYKTSEPWFGNRIQKIVSLTASNVTYSFNDIFETMETPPEISGRTIFDARVYPVPSIIEALNGLVFRQQAYIHRALVIAAGIELEKIYQTKKVNKIIKSKNIEELKQILLDECNVSYDETYPAAYRLGMCAYKIPIVIETNDEQVTRNKWLIDKNPPIFLQDKNFILGILNSGRDIFRPDR